MKKKKQPRSIPPFRTIDEMARFWDSHDLTDYEHQLDDVLEPIFELPPSGLVTFRLRPKEWMAVARIAQAKKIANHLLIKRWIQQGIRSETNHATSKRWQESVKK